MLKGDSKISGMDGETIFFTGRGGAGRGKAKNLRGGAGRGIPPSPRFGGGGGGEGVKICGAGRGRGGEHTACTD